MTTRILSDIGRWGAVPEWLIDAGVSGNAVKLFALLACKYADRATAETRGASRARLAREMGCSRDTVDRAKKELRDAGALSIIRVADSDGGQVENRYQLTYAQVRHPIRTGAEGGLRTGEDPYPEGGGSPESRPTDGTAAVLGIWFEVTGWDESKRTGPAKKRDRKAAKEIADAGRTPDEVRVAATALAQDEYWREHGGPRLAELALNFDNYLAKGSPAGRAKRPQPKWEDFEQFIDEARYPEADARADFDRELAAWKAQHGKE